jgi:hypothetical protein
MDGNPPTRSRLSAECIEIKLLVERVNRVTNSGVLNENPRGCLL